MLNRKIVLVGYSGHGLVVADAAIEQGLDLQYYSDKKIASKNPFNLKYLGFEKDPQFSHWGQGFKFALAIGNNEIRRKTGEYILSKGEELVNIMHPRASISKGLNIGKGNFINNSAVVNTQVMIGNYCVLNTGAILDHECQLDDAVHVAPGAVLAGGVEVGKNSFIGANSVIKEGISIGENVIIGAGTVVIRDVADNTKIVGNPGKII